MTSESFDFDLAVSFAGEQRDYVRGVVRGLGEDVKVFYDEDAKADLLGENLVDYFTDLYQHRAKYVAMFVSSAYGDKMWTNLERQSAMARAMSQRTPYILPIRMDDTALPGLLPTVGFVDARIEGLDGVVSILGQKLGQERVGASYAGRVPTTQADIDLLLALRPDFWEYWLYAGALRVGLDALEEKYRDYEMRFAPPSGEVYYGSDAFEFLRPISDRGLRLVSNFNALFEPAVMTKAFGEPGEPGDPERILQLAARLVSVYEGFIDEAAYIRSAALPESFRGAQAAAADMGANAVAEIRAFVDECVETMNRLPELADEHEGDEEPHTVTLVLALTIDEETTRKFNDELRAGVDDLLNEE
jgi:hypothetical protein